MRRRRPAATHASFGRCININEALYLGTFSRAGGLLLGAAFAMLWRPLALMRGPMRRQGTPARPHRDRSVSPCSLVLIPQVTLVGFRRASSGSSSTRGCSAAASSSPGWRRSRSSPPSSTAARHADGLLGNPLFNWIGTRSYGLYLFHWPIYQVIRKSAGVNLTLRSSCWRWRSRCRSPSSATDSSRCRSGAGLPAVAAHRPAASRPGRGVRSRRRIVLLVALSRRCSASPA